MNVIYFCASNHYLVNTDTHEVKVWSAKYKTWILLRQPSYMNFYTLMIYGKLIARNYQIGVRKSINWI